MPVAHFSALRHRDFRVYWIGYVISVSGQQMLWMLEPWLIYEISGSKVYLGINAIAQAVPATALVLLGGVIADKFDQRKLLIAVQATYVVLLGTLSALALTEVLTVWHIFVIAFVHSAVGSFENPARQSMFPHLVDRESMPNAVAMNAMIHPGTRIIAPVLGGVILAAVMSITGSPRIAGGTVLLLTTAGVVVYALMLTRVHLPPIKRSSGGTMLADMGAGVRFIWRERIFTYLIGMAYYNMFFGISLAVLFPVVAKDILDVGPFWLSMMHTSMGVGSVLGVVLSASLASPRLQRRLLVGGSVMLGVSMVAFALSEIYALSLAFLFLLGIGSSVFNVAIQANLQMLVPNDFRGRVMGIWSIVHTSVRPMGEMQLSAVAAVVAVPFALAASGAMVLAFALLFIAPSGKLRELGDLRELAHAEAAKVP
jgi:MFS family permease